MIGYFHVAAVGTLLISLVLPFALKPLLQRSGVLDIPNHRSSHDRPTLRGGGLAPLIAFAAAIVFVEFAPDLPSRPLTAVLLTALACGLLGWVEDYRGLPVKARAGAQLGIAVAGVSTLLVTTDHAWFLAPLAAVFIAGYINVANFLDGINWNSALHGTLVGATYWYLGTQSGLDWLSLGGVILAASFVAFLPWNVLGSGMFLGDVGSYLLGAAVATLAVAGWLNGASVMALVGPLVIYFADALFTFCRRVFAGEPWYEAHRSHVYQRLTATSLSHLGGAGVVTAFSAATAAVGLLSAPGRVFGPVAGGLLLAALVVCYLSMPALLTKKPELESEQE